MASKRPQPEDRSSAKKRRVEIPQPDGFIISSSKNKPTSSRDFKVPVFESAFSVPDTHSSSGSKKPRVSSGSTRPGQDLSSRASGLSSKSRVQLNSALQQQMGRDKPPSFLPQQLRPGQLIQPAKPVTLRPAPPAPVLPRFNTVEPGPSKIVQALKPIGKPPSNLVLPTNKPLSSRSLKVLQAPPVPVVSSSSSLNTATPRKELKGISETGAAKLVSDHAEFAAMLLQDQRPDLMMRDGETEQDKVVNRGLEQSPDKKGKASKSGGGGVGSGFVRGGLAARASQFFEQTRTGTNLWQKEMDRRTQPKSVSGSNSMDTRIVKVEHRVQMGGPRNTGLVSVLALCRVLSGPSAMHNSTFRRDTLYRVLFLFLQADDKLHDPRRYVEGCSIRIFKPWNEVSLIEERRMTRLPASLPLASSLPSQEMGYDMPVDPDKAVFCSRFILLL